MILSRAVPVLAALIVVACSGAEGGSSAEAPAWMTTVDDSGDTIRVRITGEVPPSSVRTLVAELEVGALDGPSELTFGRISSVLGSPDGGLYVFDAQAKALRQFDSRGAFLRSIGRTGGGTREFGFVNGVALFPDQTIVLWDGDGGRINRYRPDGKFISSWRLPFAGDLYQATSVWTDQSYHVHVPLPSVPGGTLSSGGLIATDTMGRVVDTLRLPRWRGEPTVITSSSKTGGNVASTLPFEAFDAARVTSDGGVVSGPGSPYLIVIAPPQGKPIRVDRAHTPVPVSAQERDENRARITAIMRRGNPTWTWTGPDIPREKPAYRGLQVAQDGRIWVRVSTAGEPIPVSEQPAAATGPQSLPLLLTREPSVFDVFSPDGRLLGRVALPPRIRIQAAAGAFAWGVRQDSLDVEYAVRFRIVPPLPE